MKRRKAAKRIEYRGAYGTRMKKIAGRNYTHYLGATTRRSARAYAATARKKWRSARVEKAEKGSRYSYNVWTWGLKGKH